MALLLRDRFTKTTKMKKVTLNNGVEMPWVGMGVFRMEDNEETARAIETALEVGYRHIDTAAYYFNEEAVARAVSRSGIPREEIFITTKLWNDDQRSGKVMEAFEASLKKLNTDYVDLYLIHWPVADKFVRSWQVLEEIYQSGRARAIGVSNFKKHHLETLKKSTEIIPAVDQIELHPYLIQQEDVDYCLQSGIRPEAWSPFAAGKTGLFDEPALVELARKYGKTPAQIVLRWDYQRGIVTIPKSSHKKRLAENIDIFDFELTSEEIGRINALNKNERIGADPDHFTF